MAKLDLRQFGLEAGDARRVPMRLRFEPVMLGAERYVAEPDTGEGTLDLQASADGLYLKLRFQTVVTGPCYRCLEPASARVDVEAAEYHAHEPEPGAEAELTSEYLDELDQLDLDRWVRDALVLGLPAKLLCRPDCAGLCPRCGTNLNDEPGHDCGTAAIDERWAALRDLDLS
jgi:uncharacterized protein